MAMAIFFMNDMPSEYSFTVPLGQNAKPSVTLIGVTRSIKATEYNGRVKFDVTFSASGKIGSKGGIKAVSYTHLIKRLIMPYRRYIILRKRPKRFQRPLLLL